eukprot:COSAG01_NODE_2720_length_7187_cov_3.163516_5_plen_324_part_00
MCRSAITCAASLLGAAVTAASSPRSITISNMDPSSFSPGDTVHSVKDPQGNVLDAHDGNIIGPLPGYGYVLYAMNYGINCSNNPSNPLGFNDLDCNHTVSAYSSPDLGNSGWTWEGFTLLPHDLEAFAPPPPPPPKPLPPGPPPAPGIFVRCDDCHPADPVYWLSNATKDQPQQVLHHIASCNMCGRALCSFCQPGGNCSRGQHAISPQFLATHPPGAPFECCMLPGNPSAPCKLAPPVPPYQPVVYRPKVIYNSGTKEYILWVNWLWGRKHDRVGGFDTSVYAVATSANPVGRFRLRSHNVTTAFPVVGAFQDSCTKICRLV